MFDIRQNPSENETATAAAELLTRDARSQFVRVCAFPCTPLSLIHNERPNRSETSVREKSM